MSSRPQRLRRRAAPDNGDLLPNIVQHYPPRMIRARMLGPQNLDAQAGPSRRPALYVEDRQSSDGDATESTNESEYSNIPSSIGHGLHGDYSNPDGLTDDDEERIRGLGESDEGARQNAIIDVGSSSESGSSLDSDIVIEHIPEALLAAVNNGNESDSSVEMNPRPKKRRPNVIESQEEAKNQPSTSKDPVGNIEDDDDNGCTICYEDYTNSGNHRLVSLKCGHFFGKECIERWIRSEKNSTCPTCKSKAVIRDIRVHFAQTIKMVDTTELETLREVNTALTRTLGEAELSLGRKDREISNLKILLEQAQRQISAAPTLKKVTSSGGAIYICCSHKFALTKEAVGYSRAFDFCDDIVVMGIQNPAAGLMFDKFALRCLHLTASGIFEQGLLIPGHSQRTRVVAFSPFEKGTILSGGEDKQASVHIMIARDRYNHVLTWKMPEQATVWSGCWLTKDKVALGVQNGRVWECDLNSTCPIRDITKGIMGKLPVIFVGRHHETGVLLVSTQKAVWAFYNEQSFPLITQVADKFNQIRSISWDENSMYFAVTLIEDGTHHTVHKLYQLEIDTDHQKVTCVNTADWKTNCVKHTRMWSNCLFSTENGRFFVAYNEDQEKIEVHDWSGKRNNAYVDFKPTNVSAIKVIHGSQAFHRTILVLTERGIFSIGFRVIDTS